MSVDNNFIEVIHFYYENGLMVLTEKYHLQRGYCCGNSCRHCPFNYVNVADEKKRNLLQNTGRPSSPEGDSKNDFQQTNK